MKFSPSTTNCVSLPLFECFEWNWWHAHQALVRAWCRPTQSKVLARNSLESREKGSYFIIILPNNDTKAPILRSQKEFIRIMWTRADLHLGAIIGLLKEMRIVSFPPSLSLIALVIDEYSRCIQHPWPRVFYDYMIEI